MPVGATRFRVEKTSGFKVGDTVVVHRNGNQAWIDEIGMNLENDQWQWEPFTIRFDRIITGINGNTVTIDAPLTCAIETSSLYLKQLMDRLGMKAAANIGY